MSNQLLAEADALPELGEYDGMSAVDIAHAIVSWPEGSEDQVRAIWALQRLIPARHSNRPPLAERLDEDFAGVRGRADAVLTLATTALIVDDESAAKVLDVGKSMATLEKDIETLRTDLVRPYRLAVELINAKAKAIAGPVKLAREGDNGNGGLRGMITKWDDKVRAETEEARLAAEAEQRKREEAAEAARRRAEEAAEAGRGVVSAELRAAEAAEEAERARIRAEAIRPATVRSNSATTSRSRVIKFDLDDDPVRIVRGNLKLPGFKAALMEFLTSWFGRYLRSLGVNTVEKGVVIAGVHARIELGSANVR